MQPSCPTCVLSESPQNGSHETTAEGAARHPQGEHEVLPRHPRGRHQHPQLAGPHRPGERPLQQRGLPDRDQLPCRVPLQAPQDPVPHQDLPPQHRREGPGVPAHHQRRELEAGHQDGPGHTGAGSTGQRARAGAPPAHRPGRGVLQGQEKVLQERRGLYEEVLGEAAVGLRTRRV